MENKRSRAKSKSKSKSEKKRARKRKGQTNSYRQDRGRLQLGPINLSPILFPLDRSTSTQGDLLQDVCDLIAWPLEQMILSSWLRA